MTALHALSGLTVALASACLLAASHARADDPDPSPLALDQRDLDPHELWIDGPDRSLWLGVSMTFENKASGRDALGAMLVASVPLERISQPRPSRPPGSWRPAADGAAARAARAKGKPRDELEPASAAEAPPPLPIPVRVDTGIARGAVAAALREARLDAPDDRIDALASRARASALLPELRVRATRLVDEAESLAPTEYDASRTTATGGTSLWLEARATWRLDRLVFVDDEVPLERMRHERAEAQSRLGARVLALLFAWQRALALTADEGRSPEEHRAATLEVLECEASLDVVTGGWFTRWRETRARAE